MKINCSIIRDILPLYAEKMVSEETAGLVEEHLAECPACTAELDALRPDPGDEMRSELSDPSFLEEAVPLKKVRKRIRRQKIGVALGTAALCIGLIGMVLAAIQVSHYEDNIKIMEAVAGAMELTGQTGRYPTSDGTASALTEEEIESLVKDYTEKVHKYYSSSGSVYDFYPWNYDNNLRGAYKDTVCYFPDSGVSDIKVSRIRYHYDGQEAELKGKVTEWSKMIVKGEAGEEGYYHDDLYHVTYGFSKTQIHARLVKEQNVWKVKDFLEFTPLENESESIVKSESGQGFETFVEALAFADQLEGGIHWKPSDKMERIYGLFSRK